MDVLVVTGGSQGIGAAVCRLAASRGWAVCLSYATGAAAGEAVASAIRAQGGQALAVQADAADEAATARLFAAAATLGPVTGAVINAGITGPQSRIVDLEAAALDRVLATNVRGAFLGIREAARAMASGAIVTVSSRAAGLGSANEWVHYAATKGALDTMTIGAARELAPRGIRVNAVAPGLIDTPLHAKAGLHDRVATMAPTIPMGRAGTAEEVAKAVLWLLSDEAAYVTGAVLPVSGGRVSWPQLDGLIAALRTAPARTGSVISTIYGDAVLPRGGAIALSDLLALTARLGASEGVVRTAVSRLAQGGVLHGRRVGRRSAYALTAAAEAEFRAAVPRIYGGPPVHWDGALRLAFPQDAAQRRALEEAGFQTLLPGVVIGLRAPTEGPACVDAAGPPAMLRELAARAWPVQALQDRYAGFIASFGDLVIPGGVDPLDAIAARIVLIHAWRRIVLRDPHLPAALLPPDWPGDDARRLCSSLYAALAGPSEAWLDQTTTGPDPLPSGPDPVGRWSPDPA